MERWVEEVKGLGREGRLKGVKRNIWWMLRGAMGATLLWSAGTLVGKDLVGEHWAYRGPTEPLGLVANSGLSPIDQLLEAARGRAGVAAKGLAEPEEWVRRAAFTLTGLPPSTEHLRRISQYPDQETWMSIVDELLASPAYGERWARRWMDVARYADTRGYHFDRDNRYPYAYTYRDWLIGAFNRDLAYPDFVKLQIAADRMVEAPAEGEPASADLAALGFLTVGLRNSQLQTLDDRVDVVTRGFLSTTVSCARCHDHKTDPIPAEDYYSLYSIFEGADEPGELPVIGKPADEVAYQQFLAERSRLEAEDGAARQRLVDHFREPGALAVYLELAWQGRSENWDFARAESAASGRGGLRAHAVLRWVEVLNAGLAEESAEPRLVAWTEAMDAAADETARAALCVELVAESAAAGEGSSLQTALNHPRSPLVVNAGDVHGLFHQQDNSESAARASALSRLLTEHPGSEPRAMVVNDRAEIPAARVFRRGNPAETFDPFERHWLSFLGGGRFREGVSPRLALAEKIADLENPLTARVMVNRVWGWHFGTPLADPGDFGPQQAEPLLLPLLDWLALEFRRSGGSLKELHRQILATRAFRLDSAGSETNEKLDEGNSLLWHWNLQRLDYDAMRDRILASAGLLNEELVGGRSVNLAAAENDARRSVYAFVDRYAMATELTSFDVPHPDHHSAQRLQTTVPQQALYFLNGELVRRAAAALTGNPEFSALETDSERIDHLFRKIYERSPTGAETAAVAAWLESRNSADYEPPTAGRWQIRYAELNGDDTQGELREFPVFQDMRWSTGPDLASAPVHWLSAGPDGGHVGNRHALVFRWRADGGGEVKFTGALQRPQQGGVTIGWRLMADGEPLASGQLEPDGRAEIDSGWRNISRGSTLELAIDARDGDNNGGVTWQLGMRARTGENGEEFPLTNFKDGFPRSAGPESLASPGDPWADLAQMLWASNEFNFIE